MPPKLLHLGSLVVIAVLGVIFGCLSDKGSDERRNSFKLSALALLILSLLAMLGAGCVEPSKPFDISSITFTSEEEEIKKDCGFGLTVTSTRIYTVTHYPSGKTFKELAAYNSMAHVERLCVAARSKAGLHCVDVYQLTAAEKGTLALDRTTQETCRLNMETMKFNPLNSLIQAE